MEAVEWFATGVPTRNGDIAEVVVVKTDVVDEQTRFAFFEKRHPSRLELVADSHTGGMGNEGTEFLVTGEKVLSRLAIEEVAVEIGCRLRVITILYVECDAFR